MMPLRAIVYRCRVRHYREARRLETASASVMLKAQVMMKDDEEARRVAGCYAVAELTASAFTKNFSRHDFTNDEWLIEWRAFESQPQPLLHATYYVTATIEAPAGR